MTFLSGGSPAVKICGITNPNDARVCLDAGADALGFNFFPGSKRFIDPTAGIPWIRELGDGIARVAVVVNPDEALLEKLAEAGCFEAIQFHGDETPEFCSRAGFAEWIKAIRVQSADSLSAALDFPTPAILLDSWSAGAYGGTGHRLDWDLARDFVRAHPAHRFLLAGGLDLSNVRQAVRIVQPAAVDVASGVESSPGKKDPYLVREFIDQVRRS